MLPVENAPPRPHTILPAGPGTEILLVHAPYPAKLRFDGLPSSLLSAASHLVGRMAEKGVAVGLLDPGEASEGFYEELERILRSGSVRVVAISTSTAAIEETARIARLAKRVPTDPPLVIVGGPHEDACSLKAAEALPEVDVSVGGDGEFVLPLLAESWLDGSSEGGRIQRLRTAVENVLSLVNAGRGTMTSRAWGAPFVRPFDSGATPVESFHQRVLAPRPVVFEVFAQGLAIPLTISRGCLYGKCTFCSEGGLGIRNEVMGDFEWIRALSARYPGVPLYFQDSIFPATTRVRRELLPLLKSLGVEWGCQLYLPTLSQNFVEDLATHGCTYVYTGVESGSDSMLQALGKTGLSRALAFRRLCWLRDTPLRAGLSLIFGTLNDLGQLLDTELTLIDTASLVDELLAARVPIAGLYSNIYTILPGTLAASTFSSGVMPIDFYAPPRSSCFGSFEDGAIGYNFHSLAPDDAHRLELVGAILDTERHIQKAYRENVREARARQ